MGESFSQPQKKTEGKFGKSIFLSLADAERDQYSKDKNDLHSLSKMGERPDTPSLVTPKRPMKKHL
jgi:hypothetical protein